MDQVNKPQHYTAGGVETIDAIEASMSPEGFADYLKGNILKYLWRYKHKGKPEQDLRKARWYLDRLIKRVAAVSEL
ncbi:MAG: hypothetical protein CL581_03585 [Alteromonadaceae bacterium]|nr:hypothetical protein [Alteromonadaceae bacterium]|tara:strand:+ start:1517 stop:1744 length:228 start_codon:yes stop_codon:yes gene_type:complete